jgi:arylsulfatase A-like enzyme
MVPTLCGLAGIAPPADCAGANYSVVIQGEDAPVRDAQLIMHIAKGNASGGDEHPAPLFRGVRTGRYTYAVGEYGGLCLFDNVADPYQLKNLITDTEYAALRKELRDRLAHWLKRAGDPFVLPEVQ